MARRLLVANWMTVVFLLYMNPNSNQLARVLRLGRQRGHDPKAMIELLQPGQQQPQSVAAPAVQPLSSTPQLQASTGSAPQIPYVIENQNNAIYGKEIESPSSSKPSSLQPFYSRSQERPVIYPEVDRRTPFARNDALSTPKPLGSVLQEPQTRPPRILDQERQAFSKQWNSIEQFGIQVRTLSTNDLDQLTPRDVGRVCDFIEHQASADLSSKKVAALTEAIARIVESPSLSSQTRVIKAIFYIASHNPQFLTSSQIEEFFSVRKQAHEQSHALIALRLILQLLSSVKLPSPSVLEIRNLCDQLDSVGSDVHQGIPTSSHLLLKMTKVFPPTSILASLKFNIALHQPLNSQTNEWLKSNSQALEADELSELTEELSGKGHFETIAAIFRNRHEDQKVANPYFCSLPLIAKSLLSGSQPDLVSALTILHRAKIEGKLQNSASLFLTKRLSQRHVRLTSPGSDILAKTLANSSNNCSSLFSALRSLNGSIPSLFSTLFPSQQIRRVSGYINENEQKVSFHLGNIEAIPNPKVRLYPKQNKPTALQLYLTEKFPTSTNTLWSLVFRFLVDRYFIADVYYGWPYIYKILSEPHTQEYSKFRTRTVVWLKTLSEEQARRFKKLTEIFHTQGAQYFSQSVLQIIARMTTIIVPDITQALNEISYIRSGTHFDEDFRRWLMSDDFKKISQLYDIESQLGFSASELYNEL